MNGLNFDLDSRLSHLESEWQQACATYSAARAEFAALAASTPLTCADVQQARARLDQSEQSKFRIMAKIERLDLAVTRKFGS